MLSSLGNLLALLDETNVFVSLSSSKDRFFQFKGYTLYLQECVRALINSAGDVNARDRNWRIPLHVAASNNHVRCAGNCIM